MKKTAIRPPIELLWLSTVNDGRQLEVNTQFGGYSHSLATVIADDADESLWLELYVGDQAVQVPLRVIEEAIEASVDGVHSETWYRVRESEEDSLLTDAARAQVKRRTSGNPPVES